MDALNNIKFMIINKKLAIIDIIKLNHWLNAKKITNQFIYKKQNDHIFIPVEAVHRIQNLGNKPVKIIEAQVGSILKETDIIRYQDVYGRIK
jgi:mannose-1-phosphate guanylyltransferase/mannose-6-phosphate isomerase